MEHVTSPDDHLEQWPLSRLLITASRLIEHDIATLFEADVVHALRSLLRADGVLAGA